MRVVPRDFSPLKTHESVFRGVSFHEKNSALLRRNKKLKKGVSLMGDEIRKIVVFDTTLRDGEQSPGASMNIKEKLEVARQLARLGVDVIEAGFPISSPGDFEAVKAISETVKGPIIAGLARAKDLDIESAGKAVGKNGRIHTFIATSPIHMEKKLRMPPAKVIETAVNAVKFARTFTSDVEFSCEDAGRTDWGFMVEIVAEVIKAGATTINIPDTVGYCAPWEFGEQIRHLKERCPNIREAVISIHCHNDLGMSVANSLAAIRAGAGQVECTINGLGERAGNASLEEIVMNLKVRRDFYKADTAINTRELYKTSRLVSQITGIRVQPNKAVVGGNAFAHEAGIHQDGVIKERTTYEIMTSESVGWTGESMVMGKHSGRHAFKQRLESLGYILSEEDLERAFDQFKRLCDLKKKIYDEDLQAIVSDEIFRGQNLWDLEYLNTNSGTTTIPTATVRLKKGEEVFMDSATGDGPIDASFKAIERIIGESFTLDEYTIDAVTGGKDAIGSVLVKVTSGERSARGRGASTDIITASIKAYLSAINSILLQKEKKVEKNGV
jgi:2-isopropylmalate synthase